MQMLIFYLFGCAAAMIYSAILCWEEYKNFDFGIKEIALTTLIFGALSWLGIILVALFVLHQIENE